MYWLLIFSIIISISNQALVKWKPNKSFSLAINFKNHILPCSRQTVVFPDTLWESVKIDSPVSVAGLVLPNLGTILFEDGGVEFGANEHDNCTEDGNAYYMPKSKSFWSQPDVWDSTRINEATPDAERVPCFDDEVEFPENAEFTVFLPEQTQYVKRLQISGSNVNTELFKYIVDQNTILGTLMTWQQFVPNEHYETGVKVRDSVLCNSVAGCMCQPNVLKVDCTLKFCTKPKCLSPVQPVGHCCKICGGYLLLAIDEEFDMTILKENVAEVAQTYGDNIFYYVGRIPNDKVQIVVVDKGEFDGTSAQAINDIAYKVTNKGFQSVAQISGGPLSSAGLGGKISISVFFTVVFVMGAIYVYYYRLPRLSAITSSIRLPASMSRTGLVLGRFNRRTESVVSLTSRRDSNATLRSAGGTAFRNPLYDSKRGRVQVEESVVEENDS